jgi:type IV pilus assembly protein PilC
MQGIYKEILRIQGVRYTEIVVFCRQLSIMISSGLSLIATIRILIAQTNNFILKDILQDIYKQIEQGKTLTESLTVYHNIFPNIVVHMISAGELGGVLDDILNKLATYLEKDYKVKEKIKAAMIYPAIILILAVLVIIFILTFVMPNFVKMFENINLQLPLPTQILLQLSVLVQSYGYFILGGLIAFGIVLFKIYKIPCSRGFIDEMLLALPIIGKIINKIAVVRFSRTLEILLRAGIPIVNALEVTKSISENMVLNRLLTLAQDNIKDGFSLSSSLNKSKFFSPMVIQMIAVGEESGSLDVVLHKIADYYEEEVDISIAKMNSLLEPFLITILGIIVGGIVISIALPMFDIVNNIYI